MVRSFPSGAEIKVMDTSGTNSKLVGNTPIRLKVDKAMGSLFFIEFSKEKYRTKKILVSTAESSNIRIDTKLEVLAEYEERLKKAVDDVSKQQKDLKKFYDKESGISELVKNSKSTINDIETQIAVYKAMLFNQKYSKGVASYDKERVEELVKQVNLAKKYEEDRQFNDAIIAIKKALDLDENNQFLLNYLAELYKLNKNNQGYEDTLKQIEKLNTNKKFSRNFGY